MSKRYAIQIVVDRWFNATISWLMLFLLSLLPYFWGIMKLGRFRTHSNCHKQSFKRFCQGGRKHNKWHHFGRNSPFPQLKFVNSCYFYIHFMTRHVSSAGPNIKDTFLKQKFMILLLRNIYFTFGIRITFELINLFILV